MSALKLKELTVIIASSLCLWSVDIASVNAAQFTFINQTNKTATDFHIKFKLDGEIEELTVDFTAINFPVPPIPPGGSYNFIADQFISAEWSFAEGKNEPVSPQPVYVPEPTTLLGTATTLGLVAFFKKHKSKK
jgi:hypothetical protein